MFCGVEFTGTSGGFDGQQGSLPQSDPPIAHTQYTSNGKAMLEAVSKPAGQDKSVPGVAGLCVAREFLDGVNTRDPPSPLTREQERVLEDFDRSG